MLEQLKTKLEKMSSILFNKIICEQNGFIIDLEYFRLFCRGGGKITRPRIQNISD